MHRAHAETWGIRMPDYNGPPPKTCTDPPLVDQAIAARLKRARIEGGYRSAVEFARRMNINPTTYHHHENGRRGIPEDAAQKYSSALDVDFRSLLSGDELRKIVAVPIVGVIYGKLEVTLMKDTNAEFGAEADGGRGATEKHPEPTLQKFHVPDFGQMEALIVQDNESWPAYRMGDAIVTHPLSRIDRAGMPPEWHGVECVCLLADGRRLLRQVFVQQDGGITLVGYAGVPPMINVHVVAAAPVEWVRRAYRRPEG